MQSLHEDGRTNVCMHICFWQLPVPAAVLALMYHEKLVSCSGSSPRLLNKNPESSSAVDSSQGNVYLYISDLSVFGQPSLILSLSAEHEDMFDCCSPVRIRGRPATFFILHALGGAIVFITDGIIVSLPINVTHHSYNHSAATHITSLFPESCTCGVLQKKSTCKLI